MHGSSSFFIIIKIIATINPRDVQIEDVLSRKIFNNLKNAKAREDINNIHPIARSQFSNGNLPKLSLFTHVFRVLNLQEGVIHGPNC